MESWFKWLLRNSKAVCGKTPGYFTNRWRMIAGFTLHCNWNCLNVTWIYPWTSLLTCCAQSVASDQARQWSQSHPQTFKTFLIMGLFSKWIPAHWSEECIYIIMSHWLVGGKKLTNIEPKILWGQPMCKAFQSTSALAFISNSDWCLLASLSYCHSYQVWIGCGHLTNRHSLSFSAGSQFPSGIWTWST